MPIMLSIIYHHLNRSPDSTTRNSEKAVPRSAGYVSQSQEDHRDQEVPLHPPAHECIYRFLMFDVLNSLICIYIVVLF